MNRIPCPLLEEVHSPITAVSARAEGEQENAEEASVTPSVGPKSTGARARYRRADKEDNGPVQTTTNKMPLAIGFLGVSIIALFASIFVTLPQQNRGEDIITQAEIDASCNYLKNKLFDPFYMIYLVLNQQMEFDMYTSKHVTVKGHQEVTEIGVKPQRLEAVSLIKDLSYTIYYETDKFGNAKGEIIIQCPILEMKVILSRDEELNSLAIKLDVTYVSGSYDATSVTGMERKQSLEFLFKLKARTDEFGKLRTHIFDEFKRALQKNLTEIGSFANFPCFDAPTA